MSGHPRPSSDTTDIAPDDNSRPPAQTQHGPLQVGRLEQATDDSPNLGEAALGSPHNPRVTLSTPVGLIPPISKSDVVTSAGSHHGSDTSQQPRSHSITVWQPQFHRPWIAPLEMLVFFLIGFGLSLAHCLFYPLLNGDIVGNSSQQEEKLRYGTAFSFLAQLALTAAVWKSYTQWLWKAVYGKQWTAKGLNKAFAVDLAPSALLSRELIRTFKLGAVMAFFGWCLILPAFFTPAALVVYQSTVSNTTERIVPYLSIANGSTGHEFAYSPPWNSHNTVDYDTTRIFTGPRTILTLLASATASTGEILRIDSPSNHSAYSLDFYGPIVKCQNANDTAVDLINGFLDEHMAVSKGTARQVDNAYYSFVPALNSTEDLVVYADPRYQEPSNATNELWMTFQRWAWDDSGNRIRNRVWQVCRLHNATYNLQLEWKQNLQNVTGTYHIGEEIGFPEDQPGEVSDMASHAYASFFWSLTDQLVGSLGWFKDESAMNSTYAEHLPQYGAMESPIRHTSVLGSQDLDVFFDYKQIYNLYVYDNEDEVQGQRLLDKIRARNRTLDVLVEELSFNMTVSLLHNQLLTLNTTRDITFWNDVNKYGYVATSLFIPYGLANLVALIAVVLGMMSFVRDGTYPDKNFQDIANAAGDPHIVRIINESNVEQQPTARISFLRRGSRYWLNRPSITRSDTTNPAAASRETVQTG